MQVQVRLQVLQLMHRAHRWHCKVLGPDEDMQVHRHNQHLAFEDILSLASLLHMKALSRHPYKREHRIQFE